MKQLFVLAIWTFFLIKRLEYDSFLATEWLKNINMKYKCYLLVSGNKNENVWANIGHEKNWESNKWKILGLDIDRNLNFNKHVTPLCRKVSNKPSVLVILSNFIQSFKQRHIVLKNFIEFQIGYCPLIWLFHSRRKKKKITHLHESSLCIVYKDNKSSCVDWLAMNGSFTFYQTNIQSLATEKFKSNEVFQMW